MKRILIIASTLFMAAATLSAQDFAKATEDAKNANDALIAGNAEDAISGFTAALTQAQNCTEEGAAELVQNCKTGIAQAYWISARSLVDAKDFNGALAKLDETVAKANEAGDTELADKAAAMKGDVRMASANNAIKAAGACTDPAEKKAKYEEALAIIDGLLADDAENGKLVLLKAQVVSALGKTSDAIECYTKAKELGFEAEANKGLAKIYEKMAKKKLSAKDYAGAIADAKKALEYNDKSAVAYQIAGTASNSLKDIDGAIKYFEEYLKIKPNDTKIKTAVDQLKAVKASQK